MPKLMNAPKEQGAGQVTQIALNKWIWLVVGLMALLAGQAKAQQYESPNYNGASGSNKTGPGSNFPMPPAGTQNFGENSVDQYLIGDFSKFPQSSKSGFLPPDALAAGGGPPTPLSSTDWRDLAFDIDGNQNVPGLPSKIRYRFAQIVFKSGCAAIVLAPAPTQEGGASWTYSTEHSPATQGVSTVYDLDVMLQVPATFQSSVSPQVLPIIPAFSDPTDEIEVFSYFPSIDVALDGNGDVEGGRPTYQALTRGQVVILPRWSRGFNPGLEVLSQSSEIAHFLKTEVFHAWITGAKMEGHDETFSPRIFLNGGSFGGAMVTTMLLGMPDLFRGAYSGGFIQNLRMHRESTVLIHTLNQAITADARFTFPSSEQQTPIGNNLIHQWESGRFLRGQSGKSALGHWVDYNQAGVTSNWSPTPLDQAGYSLIDSASAFDPAFPVPAGLNAHPSGDFGYFHQIYKLLDNGTPLVVLNGVEDQLMYSFTNPPYDAGPMSANDYSAVFRTYSAGDLSRHASVSVNIDWHVVNKIYDEMVEMANPLGNPPIYTETSQFANIYNPDGAPQEQPDTSSSLISLLREAPDGSPPAPLPNPADTFNPPASAAGIGVNGELAAGDLVPGQAQAASLEVLGSTLSGRLVALRALDLGGSQVQDFISASQIWVSSEDPILEEHTLPSEFEFAGNLEGGAQLIVSAHQEGILRAFDGGDGTVVGTPLSNTPGQPLGGSGAPSLPLEYDLGRSIRDLVIYQSDSEPHYAILNDEGELLRGGVNAGTVDIPSITFLDYGAFDLVATPGSTLARYATTEGIIKTVELMTGVPVFGTQNTSDYFGSGTEPPGSQVVKFGSASPSDHAYYVIHRRYDENVSGTDYDTAIWLSTLDSNLEQTNSINLTNYGVGSINAIAVKSGVATTGGVQNQGSIDFLGIGPSGAFEVCIDFSTPSVDVREVFSPTTVEVGAGKPVSDRPLIEIANRLTSVTAISAGDGLELGFKDLKLTQGGVALQRSAEFAIGTESGLVVLVDAFNGPDAPSAILMGSALAGAQHAAEDPVANALGGEPRLLVYGPNLWAWALDPRTGDVLGWYHPHYDNSFVDYTTADPLFDTSLAMTVPLAQFGAVGTSLFPSFSGSTSSVATGLVSVPSISGPVQRTLAIPFAESGDIDTQGPFLPIESDAAGALVAYKLPGSMGADTSGGVVLSMDDVLAGRAFLLQLEVRLSDTANPDSPLVAVAIGGQELEHVGSAVTTTKASSVKFADVVGTASGPGGSIEGDGLKDLVVTSNGGYVLTFKREMVPIDNPATPSSGPYAITFGQVGVAYTAAANIANDLLVNPLPAKYSGPTATPERLGRAMIAVDFADVSPEDGQSKMEIISFANFRANFFSKTELRGTPGMLVLGHEGASGFRSLLPIAARAMFGFSFPLDTAPQPWNPDDREYAAPRYPLSTLVLDDLFATFAPGSLAVIVSANDGAIHLLRLNPPASGSSVGSAVYLGRSPYLGARLGPWNSMVEFPFTSSSGGQSVQIRRVIAPSLLGIKSFDLLQL